MPRRKPTVAIVEDDKDMARLWRRKVINAGFHAIGSYPFAELTWAHLRTAFQ